MQVAVVSALQDIYYHLSSIGRTGKSTCMSLLLRFYELTSGRITINDRSIVEYNLQGFRKSIGVVSQEPVCCDFLFSFFHKICNRIYLTPVSMKTFVMGTEMQQKMKSKKQHIKRMHTILSQNYPMFAYIFNCFS